MFNYGFEHIDEGSFIKVQDILSVVSEEYIWAWYIGNYVVNKPMSAPYRVDKNPSFLLSYDHRGRLMFKDFGVAGMYGDVFEYISRVNGITLYQTCEKINKDLGLGLKEVKEGEEARGTVKKSELKKLKKIEKEAKKEKEKRKIQVVIRDYDESDIKYWREFGITYQTLKMYNVYCARKVYLDKRLVYTHDINSPCYVYHFPKTGNVKCYRPFSRTSRFYPSTFSNETDIQGYWQCDVKSRKKDKLLVLTKSMKDVMLLREFGIDAMAPHGEGHRILEDFIRHIKKYYKYILVLYDLDKTGVTSARNLWREHKIPPFFVPKKYRMECCKDISDLYKYKGEETCRRVIEEIVLKVKSLKQNETN